MPGGPNATGQLPIPMNRWAKGGVTLSLKAVNNGPFPKFSEERKLPESEKKTGPSHDPLRKRLSIAGGVCPCGTNVGTPPLNSKLKNDAATLRCLKMLKCELKQTKQIQLGNKQIEEKFP